MEVMLCRQILHLARCIHFQSNALYKLPQVNLKLELEFSLSHNEIRANPMLFDSFLSLDSFKELKKLKCTSPGGHEKATIIPYDVN